MARSSKLVVEARTSTSREAQAGPIVDVSWRAKAGARKRERLPSARNQGRASKTQAWPAQTLERGESKKPPFWQENERRHFRCQEGVRPSDNWRQAGN